MKKEIPINFSDENIEVNEKINYWGNDNKEVIENKSIFKTPLPIKIIVWIWILFIIFCIWYFYWRTELDLLVDKMTKINWRIENRNILIIKLVEDNKKDKIEFELVQKYFILKTNAKILNN